MRRPERVLFHTDPPSTRQTAAHPPPQGTRRVSRTPPSGGRNKKGDRDTEPPRATHGTLGTVDRLPDEYVHRLRLLEPAYLQHHDPIRQSGFSGGPERWRAERSPILQAITGDGDLIDVGCANGYLLECLVGWAADIGITLTPHGLDIGPRLVDLARARLPAHAANLHVGNAWDWSPPRRYRFVYMLYDCVPLSHLGRMVGRLLDEYAEPGGRVILGAYGSHSDAAPPFDIARFLREEGFEVAGTASGGDPVVTAFAWLGGR